MGEERRQSPRVDQAVPVRLAFGDVGEFLAAYTENISLGGVFVPTRVEVPLGTRVELTLEVVKGKGFVVVAEVAWCRPASDTAQAGVGLRFVELQEIHKRWLEAVIQKHITTAGHVRADDVRGPSEEEIDAAAIDIDIDVDVDDD